MKSLPRTILLLLFMIGQLYAASVDQIKLGLDQMSEAPLDKSGVIEVKDFVLESHSLKIRFESGRFCFLEPLVFDNDTIRWGAFFKGHGLFEYEPPVKMEKDQLRRFFDSDSLAREFSEMLLLFDGRTASLIDEAGEKIESDVNYSQFSGAKAHIEKMNEGRLYSSEETTYLLAKTLRASLYPLDKPFLVVSVDLKNLDRVQYIFDQYDAEEVKLLKYYWAPGNSFMELVNSFSIYVDESYSMINGIRKDPVIVDHYGIDAIITKGGDFSGKAEVTFGVRLENTQFLPFSLHPKLSVDSVIGLEGAQPYVYNFEKRGDDSFDRYLILDQTLPASDSLTFTFFYHGDLIEKSLGHFYLDAGSHWYPRFGFRQRAKYDLTFKTHKQFTFVSSGRLVSEEKNKDTLITRWRIDEPAVNVSFDIGYLKKYEFKADNTPPVEIYFSKDLHTDFAKAISGSMVPTGRHMEEQVAGDVLKSLQLYSAKIGEYPFDKLVIGEVLYDHGEAFPGFIHLGFNTWVSTDSWGYNQMFRAHEVAHQWWGASVGYASYHDKWLSEGFAEYSALFYYQVIKGQEKFFDKLKDIRNDIFSNRKYIFGSGEEAGPIALGYRTSSTRTSGDYSLIIYDKGAYVLHMLRNMLIDLGTMNEDRFFSLLGEFYGKYKKGEATTKAFQKLTEKYTGIEMDWFFKQWVYGNDLPEYEFSYVLSKNQDSTWTVECEVLTKEVDSTFRMFVPMSVEFESGKKFYIRPLIDKLDMKFKLPPLNSKPKKILFNVFESVLAKVKQ